MLHRCHCWTRSASLTSALRSTNMRFGFRTCESATKYRLAQKSKRSFTYWGCRLGCIWIQRVLDRSNVQVIMLEFQVVYRFLNKRRTITRSTWTSPSSYILPSGKSLYAPVFLTEPFSPEKRPVTPHDQLCSFFSSWISGFLVRGATGTGDDSPLKNLNKFRDLLKTSCMCSCILWIQELESISHDQEVSSDFHLLIISICDSCVAVASEPFT